MRIVTDYSDGRYGFREAEEGEVGIEVPATTIEMWRAVFDAESVVQRQLRDLDDALYSSQEEQKALGLATASRDLCPLCGEDRAHPSQHGNHNCVREG